MSNGPMRDNETLDTLKGLKESHEKEVERIALQIKEKECEERDKLQHSRDEKAFIIVLGIISVIFVVLLSS